MADPVNQILLLISINLSDTNADEEHPHGYSKEAFFWSFLAAIIIFVAGATFSFFEGTRTLVQSTFEERSTTELSVAFGVLGLGFLFEGASLIVATRAIRAIVLSVSEVDAVVRLLTMQLGAHSILVTGELQVRRGLSTGEIEALLRRVDEAIRESVPDVHETFWELRRHPDETA